jgi:hypothetical protein
MVVASFQFGDVSEECAVWQHFDAVTEAGTLLEFLCARVWTRILKLWFY